MGQQTAVDWLVEQLLDGKLLMPSLIEQAKQMEEEQHGNTWLNGQVNVGIKKTFQQYYNETYGTDKTT